MIWAMTDLGTVLAVCFGVLGGVHGGVDIKHRPGGGGDILKQNKVTVKQSNNGHASLRYTS